MMKYRPQNNEYVFLNPFDVLPSWNNQWETTVIDYWAEPHPMRRLLCQYLIIPEEYTEKKYSFPSHYNDDQQYGYRNSVRPSVCRSVRLSRSGIVSKRLNAPSYFLQLNHFRFSSRPTGRLCEIPTGSSLTGVLNRWGKKFPDFRPVTRCTSRTVQDSAIVTRQR